MIWLTSVYHRLQISLMIPCVGPHNKHQGVSSHVCSTHGFNSLCLESSLWTSPQEESVFCSSPSYQFSSVAQSCLTLCYPMDCSMPGLAVHHQLPEFMPIELVMSSNHLILCCPHLCLPSIFPSIRVFSNETVLRIRWPNFEVSASTSVLPMNIQDWFPLGWTGWISLQSKGLSRVFSNTTVPKHQFFGTQLSL